MTDRDDLLWIGSRLCAALDRAGRAERRVAELEAAVSRLWAAEWEDPPAFDHARHAIYALRWPQDASEPPEATSTRPDVPDAPGVILEAAEAPLPVERLWQTRLRVDLPDPDADP